MNSSIKLALFALLITHVALGQAPLSWKEAQAKKSGTITVYWFPNEPFGFKTSVVSPLKGIEAEIITEFVAYLKNQYQVSLDIKWVRQNTFREVLDHIRLDTMPGVFGIAGFSFTPERKEFMKFSPSYMADMAVLVSTQDIPIVKSSADLKRYFDGTTALTAQGTILEKELLKLRSDNNLNFRIEYTGGSEELIKLLNKRKKSFGYLNLPIYLMDLDKGNSKLNRQSFLTKRYEGRGIGMTKTSDWDVPMNAFFNSPEFLAKREQIIARYINMELYRFVETLTPENEVSLLTQEKNLQLMQLKLQELSIQEKNQRQMFLWVIIIVSGLSLVVIAFQYKKLRAQHNLAKEQKTEIEAQADEIKSINENLEATVQARTHELQTKNQALENYAFITAHKLRAPLARILGLVSLMENVSMPDKDKVILQYLDQSAKQLDQIVHSVMDAIEDAPDSQAPK